MSDGRKEVGEEEEEEDEGRCLKQEKMAGRQAAKEASPK